MSFLKTGREFYGSEPMAEDSASLIERMKNLSLTEMILMIPAQSAIMKFERFMKIARDCSGLERMAGVSIKWIKEKDNSRFMNMIHVIPIV